MPIHDWTRVDAGIFHDFHQEWAAAIKHVLNDGVLPADYYAMLEQTASRPDNGKYVPDVLTLQRGRHGNGTPATPAPAAGGVALLDTPPETSVVAAGDMAFYRRKKNVVAVRHISDDRVVAVVEVVSPGNKSSEEAFRQFVGKAADLLDRGVHLLLIDLFPPTARDPEGIHGAIWTEIEDDLYHRPPAKPLTAVSYRAGVDVRGYIEPLGVGDRLPDMPLYLTPDGYVKAPLEAAYAAAWTRVPSRWREVVAPDS
jgi:hypothetical protein